MPVTPLPPAPQTSDPGTFVARADALVAQLPLTVTEINQTAAQISLDAVTASGAAASALAVGAGGLSTSSTSVSVGTGSKSFTVQTGKSYVPGLSLTAARTSAASSIYMRGIVDSYNSSTGALVVTVSLASGSGTYSDWTLSLTTAGSAGATSETYQARSGNVQLKAADSGSWIDLTAGGFTQTFDSPSSLGSAWKVRIRNSSNGEIIIPSSDGITNWKMYPGEVRDFNCDGNTFRSVPIKAFYKVFSSADNFIWPPGYAQVIADIQGAGGGGSSQGSNLSTTTNGLAGQGGAGGARVIIAVNSPGAGLTTLVTVGIGGIGQTANQTGVAGTNSSFGDLIAFGGNGGLFNVAVARGGYGISQDTSAYGSQFGISGLGYFPANAQFSGTSNPGHGGCAEWAGGNSGVAGNNTSVPMGGSSLFGGAGGGSGGGTNSGSTQPGGAGGTTLSKAPGGGGAGGTATGSTQGQGGNGANGAGKRIGGGGGGATNNTSGNGGNGGNGGIGAGGGGGGASTGGTAGRGGNGGNGEVIITGQI